MTDQPFDRVVSYLSLTQQGGQYVTTLKRLEVKDEDFSESALGVTLLAHNADNLVSVFVPWHLIQDVHAYRRKPAIESVSTGGYV